MCVCVCVCVCVLWLLFSGEWRGCHHCLLSTRILSFPFVVFAGSRLHRIKRCPSTMGRSIAAAWPPLTLPRPTPATSPQVRWLVNRVLALTVGGVGLVWDARAELGCVSIGRWWSVSPPYRCRSPMAGRHTHTHTRAHTNTHFSCGVRHVYVAQRRDSGGLDGGRRRDGVYHGRPNRRLGLVWHRRRRSSEWCVRVWAGCCLNGVV